MQRRSPRNPSRSELDRRQALTLLGAGPFLIGPLGPPGGTAGRFAAQAPTLERLARELAALPRERLFPWAAEVIRAGATRESLLGAALVAGARDIEPRPLAGKLHAVMVVESAFQLAEGATDEEAWLAALYCLSDFKHYQARDERENAWSLPDAPEVDLGAERALSELDAALQAFDAERADRAIVAAHATADRARVFAVLFPHAQRCFASVGHKIIYTVQVERVLRRLGWAPARPVLRSLVRSLTYTDGGAHLDVHRRALELARELPAPPEGRDDPGRSFEVLRALRGRTAAEAQDAVAAALRDGVGSAAIQDGIRLHGSELMWKRPASARHRHGPVHSVTEPNAFGYVFRTAGDATTRTVSLLQSAAWLPLLADALEGDLGARRTDLPGIEELGDAEAGDLDVAALFDEPAPARVCAALRVAPGRVPVYLERMRSLLLRKAWQDHQLKYAAAVREECRLAPHLAARMIAPSVTYLPASGDEDSEACEDSRDALRRAGVL